MLWWKKNQSSFYRARHFYAEKLLLKIPGNLEQNIWAWSSFFKKVVGYTPSTLLKRYSDAGPFLWILREFSGQFFYRTSVIATFTSTSFGRTTLEDMTSLSMQSGQLRYNKTITHQGKFCCWFRCKFFITHQMLLPMMRLML